MPREVDEVWQKFQPKVRKGDSSSNFSQTSFSSSFSRNSLLSLSKRPLPGSSKVTSAPIDPERISLGSQEPSRTCQTPKSDKSRKSSAYSRRTPYKGTPDGLKQLKLERFFNDGSVEKSKTDKVNENVVIELSSDSDEDEITSSYESNTRANTSRGKDYGNVSRVLFNDASNSSLGYVGKESKSKIKTPNVVNTGFEFKEPKSHILNSLNGTHTNTSKMCASTLEKKHSSEVTISEKRLSDVHDAPDTSQLPVAEKIPQGNSKKMPNTCKNIDKGKEQGRSAEPAPFSVATQQSVLIGKHANPVGRKITRKGSTVDIPSNNSTHPRDPQVVLSKQSSETRKSSTLTENFENFTGVTECISMQSSGELWTPGHQSSHSFLDSDDSNSKNRKKSLKKNKQKVTKNCVNNITKNTTVPETRTVQEARKSSTFPANLENFARFTECNSMQSSGELWTPDHQSSPSCLDSDDANLKSKKKSLKNNKQSFLKNGGRNLTKNTTVTKNSKGAFKECNINLPKNFSGGAMKKTPKGKAKTAGGSEIVPNDKSFSSMTTLSKENSRSTICNEENYTNSGGFYTEEEFSERPTGQAFVIRTPSPEYLQDLGSIFHGSPIMVESDDLCPKKDSCSESAINLLNQSSNSSINSKNCGNDTRSISTHVQSTCNSSMSTVLCDTKSLNFNCQNHLEGVRLTESQWDDFTLECKQKMDGSPGNDLSSLFMKSNDLGVTTPSQALLGDRAKSPNEGEEAPGDSEEEVPNIVGSACQPRSNDNYNLLLSSRMTEQSSQSAEIVLSSAIAPIHRNTIYQDVLLNELEPTENLSSNERVLEWITKSNSCTNVTRSISHSLQSAKAIEKSGHASQDARKESSMTENVQPGKIESLHNKLIPANGATAPVKPCIISCLVKVYVKSYFSNHVESLKVLRKACKTKSFPEKSPEASCKPQASFLIEVIEIPNSLQNDSEPSSKDSSTQGETTSTSSKQIISLKARVQYGKWGWEEFRIECLDAGESDIRNSSSFTNGLDYPAPNVHTIEKVIAKICNCSRSLQIECFLSSGERGIRKNSIGRRNFSASLKAYQSVWGSADNPVTLSASSSFEISQLYSKNLSNNFSGRELVPEIEGDTPMPDVMNQEIISDFRSDSTSLSMAHSDETFMEPSPALDWLTQEGEASKKYAANQWKSLMQKMRSGKQSFESSSSASTLAISSVGSRFHGKESYDQSMEYSGNSYSSGQRTCPFYKKIEGTKFAVDAFSYGSIKGVSHYFLSHFHYDHYMGLRKNFSHPIYCSSVTANLVASKIGVDESLLRRIDPGQTVIVDGVKITALDANHCPGSVMLLFELPDGRTHLHVGDFRANLYMESYHALWNVDIDCLHLDTTYCDPTYKFPSQERVIENVLGIVEDALRKDSKTLIVTGSYTIGKERVFAALSQRFNFKIWAPADKRRIFNCLQKGLKELSQLSQECAGGVPEGGAARELDLLEVLSKVSHIKEQAQIHVMAMSKIKKECLLHHLYSMEGSRFTNVVAFRPTGWAQGRAKGNSESSLILNLPFVKIYEVPYSEHSSFLELERFVKFIRPKRVIKTVNVGNPKSRAAMEVHINTWLKENYSKVPLPSRNADSPKSSHISAEQKQAGVFDAGKTRNSHRRLITGSFKAIPSQDNNLLALSRGSVSYSKNVSVESQRVVFNNGPIDRDNTSSTSRIGVKRTGSPAGRPFPKKQMSC